MTAFASRADKWYQSKLGPAKRQTYRDRKRISNTRKELRKPYRMPRQFVNRKWRRMSPKGRKGLFAGGG